MQPHLKIYDERCSKNAKTLQQISYYVDEGCADVDIATVHLVIPFSCSNTPQQTQATTSLVKKELNSKITKAVACLLYIVNSLPFLFYQPYNGIALLLADALNHSFVSSAQANFIPIDPFKTTDASTKNILYHAELILCFYHQPPLRQYWQILMD